MSLPTINLGNIGRTAASLVSPRGGRPLAGQTPAGKTVTWHPRAGDLAQTGGAKFVAPLGPGAQLFSARFSAKPSNGSFRAGYELPPLDYAKVKGSPVDVRPQVKARNAEHSGKTRVDVDQLGDLSSDQKAAATAFAHDIERLGYFKDVTGYALARWERAAAAAVGTMVTAPTTFLGNPNAPLAPRRLRPEMLEPSIANPGPIVSKKLHEEMKSNPVYIAYEHIREAGLTGAQRFTAREFARLIVNDYMPDFSGKAIELEDLATVAKAAVTLGKAV